MANPDPSPSTRFKPGQSGNPGGISSETREKLNAARDAAVDVYLKFVNGLAEDLEKDPGSIVEAIRGDNLKLLKDVMDRSDGTPKQSVDHTNSDGSLNKPQKIELVAPKTDDNSAD